MSLDLNEIEGLEEFLTEGLEKLSNVELIKRLKAAISLLAKNHIKLKEETMFKSLNQSIILYLVDKYCDWQKEIISVSDLIRVEKTYKDFTIEKKEGDDFLEVTIRKESDNKKLH